MKSGELVFGIALILAALIGCEPSSDKPTTTATSQQAKPAATEPSGERADKDGGQGQRQPDQGQGCEAIEELNKLDTRRPVPLQPMMAWHQKQNMQAHLVAIQGIVDGLAREDWEGIATASKAIESSPQMQQMCQHMGAGAEGFTAMALDFHKRADAIGVAAKAKDSQAVLVATSNTLQACTGCHAVYRQDVMDSKLWSERTGSTHDPGAMHHGGGGHH